MILIVDDHVDTCRAMVRLLKAAGHEASAVHGGADALEWLERQTPRLVILDVMMPHMTGIEVLRAMRADPRLAHLPVVMFSASTDPQDVAAATRLGAKDFILKGQLDWAKLGSLIDQHASPSPAIGSLQICT